MLAKTYTQLAWSSENSVWRNIYLTGAQELTAGVAPGIAAAANAKAGIAASLQPEDLFDVIATRVDADMAGDTVLRLGFVFPDRGEQFTLTLANGVITHRKGLDGKLDATLTAKYSDFLASVHQGETLAAKVMAGEASVAGDMLAFQRLTGVIDKPDPAFPIVTP